MYVKKDIKIFIKYNKNVGIRRTTSQDMSKYDCKK